MSLQNHFKLGHHNYNLAPTKAKVGMEDQTDLYQNMSSSSVRYVVSARVEMWLYLKFTYLQCRYLTDSMSDQSVHMKTTYSIMIYLLDKCYLQRDMVYHNFIQYMIREHARLNTEHEQAAALTHTRTHTHTHARAQRYSQYHITWLKAKTC